MEISRAPTRAERTAGGTHSEGAGAPVLVDSCAVHDHCLSCLLSSSKFFRLESFHQMHDAALSAHVAIC